ANLFGDGNWRLPSFPSLTGDDAGAVARDAARRGARVDDYFWGGHRGLGFLTGKVGGGDCGFLMAEGLPPGRDGVDSFEIVVAHSVQLRKVRIVVIELGAALLQELHDFEGRGFA